MTGRSKRFQSRVISSYSKNWITVKLILTFSKNFLSAYWIVYINKQSENEKHES